MRKTGLISGVVLMALLALFEVSQAATVLYPWGGGTGNSTTPTAGQFLYANSSTSYAPTSTIFILPKGWIGFGTTTPDRIFHFTSRDDAQSTLAEFGDPDRTGSSLLRVTNNFGNMYFGVNHLAGLGINESSLGDSILGFKTGTNFLFGNGTTGDVYARLSSNANWSFGTTSEQARLTIQGSGGYNPLTIISSTYGSMFTILTNGNIGVASSSPIDTFAVQGGLQVVGGVTSTNLSVSSLASINQLKVGTDANPASATLMLASSSLGMIAYNSNVTNTVSGYEANLQSWVSNSFVIKNVAAGAGSNRGITISAADSSGISVNTFASLKLNNSSAGAFGISMGSNDVGLTIYPSTRTALVPAIHFSVVPGSGLAMSAASGKQTVFKFSTDIQQNTTAAYDFVLLEVNEKTLGSGTTSSLFRVAFTSSSNVGNLFVINNNGNVGIGNTSTPISKLSVQGTGTYNPFTILSSTAASLLTVLTNGNVGIGTSTPGTIFSIQGTAETLLNIVGGGAGQSGHFGFHSITSNSFDIGTRGAMDVSLETNDITRLRIASSSGFIGFNSTTPQALLAVTGLGTGNIVEFSSSTGQSLFKMLTNGRIGIASSSPIDTLSVQGGLQVVGGVTSTNQYVSGQFSATLPHIVTLSSSSINATLSAGSTTRPLGSSILKLRTFVDISCFTTSTSGVLATTTVRIGNGAVWSNAIQATSSKSGGIEIPQTALSSNNTFAKGLPAFMQVGNIVGTFDYLVCTYTDI